MSHNRIYYSIRVLITLFFTVIILSNSAKGQEEVPAYLYQTEWLSENDLKDWNKMIGQYEESDKLINESNDIYLKISLIETDASLDEKKKEKQISKLEKEASGKYIEALKQRRDVFIGLDEIIEKYVEAEQKRHPGHKDMQSYSAKATKLYMKSGKAETEEELESLSEANEMQLVSIERGLAMFTMSASDYDRIYAPPGSTAVEGEIVLDNELYSKYQEYVSDNTIPDPVVVGELMELEGDEASFEAYKEKWQEYSEEGELQTTREVEEKVSVQDSLDAIQAELIAAGIMETKTTEDDISKETEKKKTTEQVTESTIVGTEGVSGVEATGRKRTSADNTLAVSVASSSKSPGTMIEFRVQVAASKVLLNMSQVNAIYRGGLSIIEIKEGSYYRYQTRGSRLYSDAQSVVKGVGVDKAYITSYSDMKNVPLDLAVKEVRPLEKEIRKQGRHKLNYALEFSVQVAASRVRLSEQKVKGIYPGPHELTTVFEEGWYKYQILIGKDLKYALEVLDNCGVPKAFLVAYKNGRKQNLYQALIEYKTYSHE